MLAGQCGAEQDGIKFTAPPHRTGTSERVQLMSIGLGTNAITLAMMSENAPIFNAVRFPFLLQDGHCPGCVVH